MGDDPRDAEGRIGVTPAQAAKDAAGHHAVDTAGATNTPHDTQACSTEPAQHPEGTAPEGCAGGADSPEADVAADMGPVHAETEPDRDTRQHASRPLSWAERAAVQAQMATQDASSSSTASVHQPSMQKLVDVKLAKDGIIDYLLFLAEQKAGGSQELPEQLRKFEGCLEAGVAVSAQSAHARLGLVNTANTCYVNVVIQSFLPCNALMWILRRCGTSDPRRPVLGSLVSLCKEFHTRKPDAHGDVLNLFLLPQVKETIASWQKFGAQQDAGEFLYYLLAALHDESRWKVHEPVVDNDVGIPEEETCVAGSEGSKPSAWAHVVKTSRRQVETRTAGLHEDSPIIRIFGGLLQSAVRSKSAKADSVSLEPFTHLDVDISSPAVTSIRTALQAFCNPEAVSDGKATKRMQVKLLPKVLILNLKRFSFVKGKGGAQKVGKPIKYEEKLTFDRSWLADDVPSQEYYVTALICHHGDSVHKGHYTCIVRYNSEWYLYDDTIVRRIDHKEVGAQQYTVYLLVYQSRGTVSMMP